MKVAVLGSGVIGVTTAYYLNRAGHAVVVLDRQEGPALETSFANAGMLYTAKGTAALLVPLAALVSAKGDWSTVLWIGAAANVVVALLAILVLRPMRAAMAKAQG